MVIDLDAKKVKHKYMGLGPKIRTVTLPDGTESTEFQDWRMSFGRKKTRRRRDIRVLEGVTKEGLLADRSGMYFYDKLCAVAPGLLFEPNYYILQYQVPDAPFVIQVKVDSAQELARMYAEFESLPPKETLQVVVQLVPRDHKVDEVFDKRPPKKVKKQLIGRAVMTDYLKDLYMAEKISISKFDEIMTLRVVDVKREVYGSLPKNERPDHQYLVETQKKKKRQSPEEMYLSGEIDLLTFSDMKYPERMEKRIHQQQTYPLPESMFDCIICLKPLCADIKCMECEKRVCRDCMNQMFVSCPEERAFVLLHHMYCLRLGKPLTRKTGVGHVKLPTIKGGAGGR